MIWNWFKKQAKPKPKTQGPDLERQCHMLTVLANRAAERRDFEEAEILSDTLLQVIKEQLRPHRLTRRWIP